MYLILSDIVSMFIKCVIYNICNTEIISSSYIPCESRDLQGWTCRYSSSVFSQQVMNANLLAKYLYKAGDTVKQGRAGYIRKISKLHTHTHVWLRESNPLNNTELSILNPQEPEMQEPLQIFKLLEARISAASRHGQRWRFDQKIWFPKLAYQFKV